MPAELWAEIFLHTRDCEDKEGILDDHAFKAYNLGELGYVIATVCRTLRAIVPIKKDNLGLDLCIEIGPLTRTQAHLEGPVAMFSARSREHPLDIRFEVDANGADVSARW